MAGKIEIPSWLNRFISESGAQEIQEHVESAELKTRAEIVPMIVRSSATKGFLPFHIFLIFALIHITFFRELPYFGVYILLGLSLPLSIGLAKIPFIQRLLIPKADQALDVFHRAHFEFFEKKISGTESKLGVLIFVSLNEHRAVVLADESVSAEIDSHLWEETIEALLKGIKAKDARQGFIDAIDLCSKILSQKFPAQGKNPNELHNHLIIEE